jgi:hypothetical protein
MATDFFRDRDFMTDQNTKPSTAVSPDLDWSQIRETVRMLFLSVAQIEIAMRESDDSVEQLTTSFTTMMDYENNIAKAVEQLPDTEETRDIRETIKMNTELVTQEMQGAIMAFQFYDKLTQRLSHVGGSIEGLSDLVNDISKIYNPLEWQNLQQQIKSKYSMREEHEMFDSVMNGMDVREAIRQYNEVHKEDLQDDIEFF